MASSILWAALMDAAAGEQTGGFCISFLMIFLFHPGAPPEEFNSSLPKSRNARDACVAAHGKSRSGGGQMNASSGEDGLRGKGTAFPAGRLE